MTSKEIKYLYLINDDENDFITTSFQISNDNIVTIYNFNEEISPFNVSYLAIDYSWDAFSSFNNKYTNSKALKFYKCYFVSQDIDRMILILKIIETDDVVNLKEYKRDIKINKIINEQDL
jgi:hypothetical protein